MYMCYQFARYFYLIQQILSKQMAQYGHMQTSTAQHGLNKALDKTCGTSLNLFLIIHLGNYIQINAWWNGLSNGQKAAVGIMGLNSLVFVMWRVPSLTRMMIGYFAASPVASKYQYWHTLQDMQVWRIWKCINVSP